MAAEGKGDKRRPFLNSRIRIVNHNRALRLKRAFDKLYLPGLRAFVVAQSALADILMRRSERGLKESTLSRGL